jgi:UDP:flavonoid glycosyltransferase YjiC (YdhE family)
MFAFDRIDEEAIDSLVYEGLAVGPKRPLRWAAAWREWLVGSCAAQLADLEDVLNAWDPDAIVCDMAMTAPFLVIHETRGVPVAVLSHVAGCLLSADGRGVASRIVGRRHGLASAAQRATRLMSSGVTRAANRLRADFGLDPLTSTVTEHAGTMPLYLVPSSPELDGGERELPPSVHYVGRCVRPRPAVCRAERPSRHEARTICVAPGFLPAWSEGLFRKILETLVALPARIVVVQQPHARLTIPQPLAANVIVVSDIDEGLVEADALVTSGESTEVLAAAASGVPLVVVPVKWEQPMNARHVALAGIGVRIWPPQSCTRRRLRAAIERVMSDAGIRERAGRLALTLARCGGASRAAERLEALVAPVETRLSMATA